MAKSYYKTIQGVRYDRALLEAAEERIYGQGDGRISKKDAEEIVGLSKDGGRITETELRTLKYISENYHFSPKAAAWFAGKLPDIEQAVDPDQFDPAQPLTQQLPELDQASSPLPEQDLSTVTTPQIGGIYPSRGTHRTHSAFDLGSSAVCRYSSWCGLISGGDKRNRNS